ncbi:PAS domain S-box protein [Alkalinema sp. FACHB-956]|uniref:PAS domain S-box protein n=1 Tax=Alkalinema sp. FACHB-956 TaxID=2692768 RepID=UPI0016881D93|nr:PAS domain S-box protein [Alkalinema sp. FACHB-956]MBD2328023.1 PAS domain S-box protein [Alkalinema sp. FACHB-956]
MPYSFALSCCQKFLDRMTDLAWMMDDRGHLRLTNPPWKRFTGQSHPAQDLGLLWDWVEPSDRDRIQLAWEAARSSLTVVDCKVRLKNAQGVYEWMQVSLEAMGNDKVNDKGNDKVKEESPPDATANLEKAPLDSPFANHRAWLGVAVRLGSGAMLPDSRQSSQFVEALLTHASDGIVACDAQGQLVLFNRAAQMFHGLPPEPISPEHWSNYYDLYDRSGTRPLAVSEIPLYRALAGETVEGEEIMIKPKAGQSRSLLSNGACIYSATGEKLGAVVLMRDITAYKRATEALEQSEKRFRAIFNQTFQFIGLLQPDGTLIEANQTALEFGGVTAAEVIQQPFWDTPWWRNSSENQQQLRSAIARAAQGEFIRYEVEVAGAEGQTLTIDFSLTPIRDAQGKVTLIIPEGRDITAMKQAEAMRLRTELYTERLSIALRVAKAAAWTWDLQTQKLSWTPEFEALFDYEPGSTQQIYDEWFNRVHPDDRARVERELQKAIDQETPEYRCEYRIQWQDGQIRWIDGVGEIHPDDQGQPRWMSGLVYDITDRKLNEAALQRSEEFTRRILESNQDCIKVLDLEGNLLYMNDNGQSLMEIDNFSQQAANHCWLHFWQGEDQQMARTALTAAQSKKVGKFEGFCPTAKGTPKWWEVTVTPILGPEGEVEQLLSVSRDITDRRKWASALQQSEALFRTTFEQTALGFCHVSLEGQWLRVNRKLCEIVGYRPEELLQTTFQAITAPEDLPKDLALVEQLLKNEIPEYSLEKRYIHKQGHHVWVNITVSLVRESTAEERLGKPSYFLSAVEDITERKQLELQNQQQTEELQLINQSLVTAQQRLRERNQELDQFVYIASHDLKAPLRAIANLSEWIEDDLMGQIPEENQQQLQLLRQRVHRMDALIDGLLRYSRVGRQDLAIESVDVADLVQEVIDSLAPPPGFNITIAGTMPTLRSKRLLLHQVFANLMSNAIKHHDRPDGSITIACQPQTDQYYQFTVKDDGPGIPETEHERIFGIFQTLQADHSTDNTGIGLALVKKIVEAEGGQITVHCDIPRGCQFSFTWPQSIDR